MNIIGKLLNKSFNGRHVCPWWMGYFIDNPLRRCIHPSDKILFSYVQSGMRTMDFGCGFGHFSLGMARLTGQSGQVIAVDIQQKMLDKTMNKAMKAGLQKIIQPRLIKDDLNIMIGGKLDFVLMANVLHEISDPVKILVSILNMLKSEGKLLIMEPMGHLTCEKFEQEVNLVSSLGFKEAKRPRIIRQWAVLCEKASGSKRC